MSCLRRFSIAKLREFTSGGNGRMRCFLFVFVFASDMVAVIFVSWEVQMPDFLSSQRELLVTVAQLGLMPRLWQEVKSTGPTPMRLKSQPGTLPNRDAFFKQLKQVIS